MHDHSLTVIRMLSKKNSWCALRKGLSALLEGALGSIKKTEKALEKLRKAKTPQ